MDNHFSDTPATANTQGQPDVGPQHTIAHANNVIILGSNSSFITESRIMEVQGNYVDNKYNASTNQTVDATPLPSPQRHSSAMFTGRSQYLDRLENHFCSDDKKGRKHFLLYGMGGIGKTQICLKFVEEHGKKFSHIFWIDASSESNINLKLGQIAKANNLSSLSAASALDWIAESKKWLIIYDNADGGYQVVEKFLPPGDGGNILITSRNKYVMRIIGTEENSMEVLQMKEEEALSLLKKFAKLDDTLEDVKNLAKQLISKLGGVPLAIDQAGAYMLSCNYPLEDYLELFVRHQDQLMSDPSFKGASGYGSSTYGTWEISMKEIEARASKREDPRAIAAESAITLHKIFAFLHYENIPKELFKNAAKNYNNRNISMEEKLGLPLLVTKLDAKTLFLNARREWDELQFQDGIKVLLSFSLLRSNGNIYSIHPLVHAWSRDRIPKTAINEYHLITKALMSCSVDLDNDDNYKFCVLLAPHIRASNVYAAELQLKEDFYDDHDRFTQVFTRTGSWSEAQALQMSVMEARKAKLGLNHKHTLVSMRHMAFTYWDQGRWDEVKKLNIQIMETSRKLLGADHQFTLDSMRHLAAAYWGQGKMKRAQRLETQIMETHKANLGQNHPFTLKSMESLAVTYLSLNKASDAEELLLHVVNVRERDFGLVHYDTLYAKQNLATAYYNLGRLQEAETLYGDVFDTRKAKFGESHPDTLHSMGRLGSTYKQQGKADKAHNLLSQAVGLMTQSMGSKDPTTQWYRKELDELSNKGASSA